MENTVDTTNQNVMQQPGGQMPLPNATAVLVLGIISIPTCICYGFVGLIIGIIGLALASKAKKLYEESPEKYAIQSYNNMKAGKVCALIGTILSALVLIYYIIILIFVGATIGSVFEAMPWDNLNNF
ncbi:MAG: hypothetical protein JXB49_20410 [Bacteroidales bacterium]|nr:hypothetical protein [Bacteroidales bacterium]